MSALIYRCDKCGAEHADSASAAKMQFCWKCGGNSFTARDPAEDSKLMALKNEALLLVITELARRLELDGQEVLEMLTRAEAQITAANDAEQVKQEQCFYCKEFYPKPISYNHSDEECVANQRAAVASRGPAAAREQRSGSVADGDGSARSGPQAIPRTGDVKSGSIPDGSGPDFNTESNLHADTVAEWHDAVEVTLQHTAALKLAQQSKDRADNEGFLARSYLTLDAAMSGLLLSIRRYSDEIRKSRMQHHLDVMEKVASRERIQFSGNPRDEWVQCSERNPDINGAQWFIFERGLDGEYNVTAEYYHFVDGWATDSEVVAWWSIRMVPPRMPTPR